MKKLVVTAALLVAAVSSYARPESFDVYNIRITLKTTKANAGIEDINYRTVTTKKYRAMYILSTGDRFDVSYNTILLGFDGVLFEDTISWNNVVRIGKNNTEIEADGYVEGNDASIYMQGFGRYDLCPLPWLMATMCLGMISASRVVLKRVQRLGLAHSRCFTALWLQVSF